jgi:hypothetical protein
LRKYRSNEIATEKNRKIGDTIVHRAIIGFHQDLEQHWVAELDCGHCQHTRHEPPFFPRPWVTTTAGRKEQIGRILNCVICDREAVENSDRFDL